MAEEKKKHTALKIIGGVTATAASAYAGFSYVIFRHAFDLKRSMIHKSTNLIHQHLKIILKAIHGSFWCMEQHLTLRT